MRPAARADGPPNGWQPVKPKFVVEVSYDHFTGERFRHGTSILRWRPDKKPTQCTMEQVKQKVADKLMRSIAFAVKA
jgi:ATP-dependent DNA ligase